MNVSIGNGLYAQTNQKPSLLEQARQMQASCDHRQRDPTGTCYRCGQREGK